MTDSLPSIAVLGAGAMGESVLTGLTGSSVAVDGIRATCHSDARADELRRFAGVEVEAVSRDAGANTKAARASDVVVVAVTPDRVSALLQEISASLRPNALVISLAAGITLSQLTRLVPASVTVLRALPNLGGKVRLGVTGVGTHDACGEESLRTACELFDTVGTVVTVRDDQLDALSTISGSGPAYVYYLVEQLAAAAVDLGFSAEQATRLAEDTFIGAAAVMRASGESAGDLLVELATPPSATIRAVGVLSNAGLKDLLLDAAAASMARAREIADEADT